MASRNRAHLFTWNNYPATIALTSTDYQRVTAWLDENSLLRLECLIFKGTAYGQAEKLFLLLEPSFLAVILPLQPVTMVRTIDTVVRRENRTPSLIETSIVGETYLPILPTEAQLRKLAGRMLGILQKNGDIENIPADIRVRQYSTLLKIQRDYMPRWSDSEDLAVLGLGRCWKRQNPIRA